MNGSADLWGLVGGIIGGTLGSSAVVLLIATTLKERWIERVRANYAKELEELRDSLLRDQKALQARVDRSVFVSKAQFDAEFNAMRDIFRYATETSLAMDQIRPPMFACMPVGETSEERLSELNRRLTASIAPFNQFSSQVSILRPFYPESLFVELSECRKFASIEIGQVQNAVGGTFSPEWYRNGQENRDNFSSHYQEAGRIIRNRLDQLAVVPTSV